MYARLKLGTALCASMAVSAGVIEAAAIYSTTVGSTFGISTGSVALGPSGLTTASMSGAGLAGGGGLVSPAGVRPATKDIGVAGSAPSPGSAAVSTFMSGHLITIDNSLGLTPIVVPFTFDYFWIVSLSAGPAPDEFASGGGFFHITGIDNEVLTIAGIPVSEYLAHHSYTTALGGTGGSGGALVSGAIFVPAGVLSVFSVITDTTGSAVVVPEPGTAASLLLAGGLLLGGRRFFRLL